MRRTNSGFMINATDKTGEINLVPLRYLSKHASQDQSKCGLVSQLKFDQSATTFHFQFELCFIIYSWLLSMPPRASGHSLVEFYKISQQYPTTVQRLIAKNTRHAAGIINQFKEDAISWSLI